MYDCLVFDMDDTLYPLSLVINMIFTNADEAHAGQVFSRLCLQDCFQGVMCFETLNPPMRLEPVSSIEGMNEVQTENVETQVLCKPSVQAMEADIAIANGGPPKKQ
ncbi:unnamed protein product [Fraxinus pennsylvanica]|uniref:Uncharacterized protein n=1 Tax=Fraxinus pennsylvanica TaxID=56036 RepID=A0AAD1YR64_9LAMI|nr:unnamed protein product [Fraxinus pennsylvanica]